MANGCQRVIVLHAITEENISVSHQTLAYVGRGMVTKMIAVHFLPESQYPGKYR